MEEYKTLIWDESPDTKVEIHPTMTYEQLMSNIDDGELPMLHAYGLEYHPLSEYYNIASNVLKKIEVGGTVVFRITNLGHVIKNVLRREFEPEKYNEYLWNGKKSGITVDKFREFVSEFGQVLDIRMEGAYYYVTVQR